MSSTDVIFEAVDNTMLSLEAKLDDPRFAHDKQALETAHLAIHCLRTELFKIMTRERL